jgi:hypothetical protein
VKKFLLLFAAVLVMFAASCDTKNVGTQLVIGPYNIQVNVPADMYGAETYTWTFTWSGASGPYTINVDMGGGANNDMGTATGETYSADFTMVEGTHTYTVTVTDDDGNSESATGSYTVMAPLNQDPVVNSTTVTGTTVTVNVSDPDGDDLTVTLASDDASITVAPASVDVAGGSGDAVFSFAAADTVAGGSANLTATVDDGNGGTANGDPTAVTVDPINLAEGAVGAFASATNVAAGDEVTFTIVVGDFPAAAPFAYMNSFSLVSQSGAQHVNPSVNIGAPGGDPTAFDGLWSGMPDPMMILDFSEGLISPQPLPGDATMVFLNYNISPVWNDAGAAETTNGGALFNVTWTFDSAGTYDVSVYEGSESGIRTYYSDGANAEHEWGDFEAPTTITVN